jgi:hypothetical protein
MTFRYVYVNLTTRPVTCGVTPSDPPFMGGDKIDEFD